MKDVRLVVRLSAEESDLLGRLAKREGLTVSAYVRHLVAREGQKLPQLLTPVVRVRAKPYRKTSRR